MFLLGIIAGLIVALLFVLVLVFFRSQVETKTKIVERWVERQGPRPTGSIFTPEDEAEEVRKEIIKKNRMEGKDTPISELR